MAQSSKSRSLPVRVVSTPTPPRVESVRPPEGFSVPRVTPRGEFATATQTDRRTLTLVLVAIFMVGVVIAWVIVVGSNLAEPNQPNSLLQSIQKNVQDAFNR